MSDSVRPHRWQPTRLCRPWDSPGKNTGVGCHFLLQCMKVKSESEVAQSSPTLSDPMDCSPPGSSIHGIFPGKSTGVGCHCLLQQRYWQILISLLTFDILQKHEWYLEIKRCFLLGRKLMTNLDSIWRRQWHPTPVLLPGKSHGWRSLVGCSPWGR